MLATAQRYTELHPEIEIAWEKQSLKAFEDSAVEKLALDYDLIVLDHPSISQAVERAALLPLDQHLAPEFLADQAANAIGASHASYHHAGHQWALAIDAAAPVAFWRDDLLARHDAFVPRTWDEVVALARRGHVEVPAAPINCLMNFYALCVALGETPFAAATHVASREVALAALGRLRELLALCDPGCWSRNPIASHDLVASAENSALCYCPLAYGYSNYAHAGYAEHRLTFGEPPTFDGAPLRTTLGGAGLAISAVRRHAGPAVAYAQFVASPAIQRTLYPQSGGQPGYRAAWLEPENNRLTNDYFARTLSAVDRAYLRPRYRGYLRFQEKASPVVQAAVRGTLPDAEALAQLESLYRASSPQPVPRP
jgi:multiple sugar transport system substrate-binding protein